MAKNEVRSKNINWKKDFSITYIDGRDESEFDQDFSTEHLIE